MQIAALCHAEMAKHLTAVRAVLSSTMEFMLGRSPTKAFQVEVVDELLTEFLMQ
jgi:hypothetical protein